MHTTVFPSDESFRTGEPQRDAPSTRRPWFTAIVFALVPVAFTASGSAAAEVLQLSDSLSALVIASAALTSAGAGFALMAFSRQRLPAFGLQRPESLRAVAWLLPALATVAVAAATQTAGFDARGWLPYAALAVAVALNEEFWFRGIILTALRIRGTTSAIYGSAALFGILHLTNLAGGEDLAGTGLQVAFALVFGVAAAQLAVLTHSIWPAIAWHALWDFTNFLSGNRTTPLALAGVGLSISVVLGYAFVLRLRIQRSEQRA